MDYNKTKENVHSYFANTKKSYVDMFKGAANEILRNAPSLNENQLNELKGAYKEGVQSYMQKLADDNNCTIDDLSYSVNDKVKARIDTVHELVNNIEQTTNNIKNNEPVADVFKTLNQKGTKYADRLSQAKEALQSLDSYGSLNQEKARKVQNYVDKVFNDYEANRGHKVSSEYNEKVTNEKQQIDNLLSAYVSNSQASSSVNTSNSQNASRDNLEAVVLEPSFEEKATNTTTADKKAGRAGAIDDYVMSTVMNQFGTPAEEAPTESNESVYASAANAIKSTASNIRNGINEVKEKAAEWYQGQGSRTSELTLNSGIPKQAYDKVSNGARKVSGLAGKLAGYAKEKFSREKDEARLSRQNNEDSGGFMDKIKNTYSNNKKKAIGLVAGLGLAAVMGLYGAGLAGKNSTNATKDATKTNSTVSYNATNSSGNGTKHFSNATNGSVNATQSTYNGTNGSVGNGTKLSTNATNGSVNATQSTYNGTNGSVGNGTEVASNATNGSTADQVFLNRNGTAPKAPKSPQTSATPASENATSKKEGTAREVTDKQETRAKVGEDKLLDRENAPEKISGISSWTHREDIEPALEKILENPSELKNANPAGKQWFSIWDKDDNPDTFTPGYNKNLTPDSMQNKVVMYQNTGDGWEKADSSKSFEEGQLALGYVDENNNFHAKASVVVDYSDNGRKQQGEGVVGNATDKEGTIINNY